VVYAFRRSGSALFVVVVAAALLLSFKNERQRGVIDAWRREKTLNAPSPTA